ncbi:MAG: hypothetical protein AAF927_11490 [Bacteroidota bacterium]
MRISLLILGLITMACMWDDDTVEMEFQQFPGTIELISGHFLRHSPEFYYWRIKDRQQKLQSADSLHWYDDLAVAYSKLGQDKKAIEIATAQLEKAPHRYETLANLGTFYIHDGQYQAGLAFLEEAIKINPEAHFGREKYQIALVEYLIEIDWKNNKKLPLNVDWDRITEGYWGPHHIFDLAQYDPSAKLETELNPFYKKYKRAATPSFYEFLLANYRVNTDSLAKVLPTKEQEAAIQGVSGMLKFGNYNSPILMEVLGELLVYNYDIKNGNRNLAIAAFIRASELCNDAAIKEVYYQKIYQVMEGKGGYNKYPLSTYRGLLAREVKAAEDYYEKIRADEMNWIVSGKDPEEEFARKYYRSPKILRSDWNYALGKNKNYRSKREFGAKKRDDLTRLDWKPRHEKIVLDSTLKSYVDSMGIAQDLPSEEKIEVQESSNENEWGYGILIVVGLLIGGLYACKRRTV